MERKILLSFFFLVSMEEIKSQTLTFEYENGGNQVLRKYCAACTDHTKTTNKVDLITKEEFSPTVYQVKVYPNPTKDKVHLIWAPELGGMIQKIEYVTYNFTQYREIPFNKMENRVTLDLSKEPIGMYVIIFHLNIGEKLTYKILKQ